MSRSTSAPAVRAAAANSSAPRRDADAHVEVRDGELQLTIDTRSYRVRGLDRNHSLQQLRVTVLATRDGLVHLDSLDLCKARSRASFIQAAAAELYVEEAIVKRDVGRWLLEIERVVQAQIEAATRLGEAKVELTDPERDAALDLLRSPQLTDRILADYEACGLVGEETNKLVCYLACVSRLLPQPLAVLIQSASAAGKTALMDATLAFAPPEHQIRYSAMTGQSLYYMHRHNLKHKILAVAEEEGVAQASYALKLLQSDGRLRIAAAGKNQGNGRQETQSYEVEGPVMMFLSTTNEHPDPELANRCLTLHVNESPAQTAAIHARQRAAYTLESHNAARDSITTLHANAQRLLEPLPVVIPWAEQLTFRHDQTWMRREHAKYLALIAASALLHQHQRPRKTRTINLPSFNGKPQATASTHVADPSPAEYLEATLADVELAHRLAGQVLGQSLDSLLPQTRRLLVLIDDLVTRRSQDEQRPCRLIRFTQRELRETLAWGDFQLRRHLNRLVELEYVLVHRTGYGNRREYELLYNGEGRDGQPFLLGLIDPAKLDPGPGTGAPGTGSFFGAETASPPQTVAAEKGACPPDAVPPDAGNHPQVRIDHLDKRNDAHPMPLRSASEPPSSTPEDGANGSSNNNLRRSARKTTRKKVKGQ